MADNNSLFAPPTQDELKQVKPPADIFAPPSKEELALGQPQPLSKVVDINRLTGPTSPENQKKSLEGLGQILDYPGGLVRTGLASVGGLLQGRTDVVKPQDVSNAFQGKAPKSSEYMERLGVPTGPVVPKDVPFIGNISARDVGGFVTDVATDPMTALARGEKALNPAGQVSESLGKNSYRAGLKKVDERLVEKGKGKLSDLLLENGAPTGTTKQIAEKAKEMSQSLSKERDAIYKQASDHGASIDLGFPLENAENHLAEMRKNPGQRDLADKLEEYMNKYKKEGKVSLEDLSKWKTNFYEELPDSAFMANGRPKGAASEFVQKMAKDFKEAIIDSANKATPGAGDAVDAINQKWGTLLSARKPMDMQIRRGETTNFLTSVDAILFGMGHGAAVPVKKAADLGKSTWFRTKAGKGLIDAGQSGAAQGLLNRGIINSERAD